MALLGCGDEGSDDPFIQLLERANDADAELGGRMVVRGTVSLGGSSLSIRGYGQVEANLKRGRFVFVDGGVREETFDDEPFTFIPVDREVRAQVGDVIPRGTKWLKVDQDRVAKEAGTEGLRELQNLTPSETLELLPRLDPKVQPAGSERVLGVATKRYRVTLALPKLAEVMAERAGHSLGCALEGLTGTMRMVLWIDGDDLIRRLRIRLKSGGQSMVITSTVTALRPRPARRRPARSDGLRRDERHRRRGPQASRRPRRGLWQQGREHGLIAPLTLD